MKSERAYRAVVLGGVLIAGSIILGALVPRTNNPAAILLAMIAVGVGIAVHQRWGMHGLLVMLAWLLWYPLSIGPLTTIGGPLTAGITIAEAVFGVIGAVVLTRSALFEHGAEKLGVPAACAVAAVAGYLMTLGAAHFSATFFTFRDVMYMVLLMCLAAKYTRTTDQTWPIVWGVVASTAIQFGMIFWGEYLGHMPFYAAGIGAIEQGTGRLAGIVTLPGAIAVEAWGSRASGVIAVSVAALLILWMFGRRLPGARAVPAVTVLLSVFLVATGGRAGWLGLGLGVLVAAGLALISSSMNRPRAAAGLFGVSAALLLTYALASQFGGVLSQRVAMLLFSSDDSALASRVLDWNLNLRLLQASPFGIGFNTLITRYGTFEHNTYLILANGVGPLGLFAFVALWCWIGVRSVGLVRHGTRDEVLLGMISVAALVVVLVAGSAENTPFLFEAPWLLWGCAVGVSLRFSGGREAEVRVEP